MRPAARRALVLEDLHSPSVLAAVRALGEAGWDVGLGVPGPGGRVSRSRWVRRTHLVPSPEDGLEPFAAGVAEAVRQGGYAIVFCGDDAELMALSATREKIDAVVPWAPHTAVLAAVDKLSLIRAAERAGLAAPRTTEATPAAQITAELPVFVKPRLHWTPGSGAAERHLPVTRCATREEVAAAVQRIDVAGGESVLQAPLSGDLMAMSVVMDRDGSVRGAVQQRSSRVSLRATSTRARTEPVDSELLDGVRRLLAELAWEGLANLQFLQPPDDRPHLIDLNGRFYGSLALATRAGVNLPVLWAEAALGVPAGPCAMGRPGARFSALEEDLRRARVQRDGGLARDVGGSLRAAVGAAHVTWSPTDPLPAVVTAGGIARSAVGRLTGARA